jgi:predicted metal-dependent peptidase
VDDADLDRTRFAAARLVAAEHQPFLATALWALTPVVRPGLDTFAVDERWRLHVDPAALDRWTVPEVAAVLLHEVGHLVRDHAGRARAVGVGPFQAHPWNLAADAEINDDLAEVGLPLPGGGVLPGLLGLEPGLVAEHYYARLIASPPPALPGAACGAGCHGVGELVAGPSGHAGVSVGEAVLLRRAVAEAIRRHGPGAPGHLAGGWLRWADATLQPVVDWRRELRAAIRASLVASTGAVDHTYRRPSRRRVPGVVLPSLHRPLPRVAVVVDTSASMDADQLDAAWSEVRGCLRAVGVRRELLQVHAGDVAFTRVGVRRRSALSGGGGTDMARAIAEVAVSRPAPAVIVVLTDGWTPWPAEPPRARVVVGLVLHPDQPSPVPPQWARVVAIPTG